MLLKYKKTNITSFIAYYLFLIILLFLGSYKFFISNFEEIEDSLNTNKITTILNIMNNDIKSLEMSTRDYSNWDDTYEFMIDENKELNFRTLN